MRLGEILKEQGMALVLENAGEDWQVAALNLIRRWRARSAKPGKLYAFEDIKKWVVDHGLEPPPHCNAWGAIAKEAVKERIIEPTGLFRLAKSPVAHSRVVRLYRMVR